jgi:hypothetical protein
MKITSLADETNHAKKLTPSAKEKIKAINAQDALVRSYLKTLHKKDEAIAVSKGINPTFFGNLTQGLMSLFSSKTTKTLAAKKINVNDILKSRGITMARANENARKFKNQEKKQGSVIAKNGVQNAAILASVSDSGEADAETPVNNEEFIVNKGDISSGSGDSIFQIISNRYLKSILTKRIDPNVP